MRFFYCLVLILFNIVVVFGQQNQKDSTVQVIAYWKLGDTLEYTVQDIDYKIKGKDTTSYEYFNYDLRIHVVDSTSESYTLHCLQYNFDYETSNPILAKIYSMSDSTRLIINTDAYGTFQELENWEEVREMMRGCTDSIKKEFKDFPQMAQLFEENYQRLSSKESIEINSIEDIQIILSFHGGKYKLGEKLVSSIKVGNNYGGEPFDSDLVISLDSLDYENGLSYLLMYQEVDGEQLTKAAYEEIKRMDIPLIKNEEDMPELKQEELMSLVIHETGWVVYGVYKKDVLADGIVKTKKTILELK